jgi:mRNA interferase HigB
MKLVGRELLEEFVLKHADARGWIGSWAAEVESANWGNSQEIRARYASASLLANNTIIFNVKGNNYRLETKVAYKTSIVLVIWIGTHAEYSKR